ncbi:NUDT16 (predicted) [Pycnogonum litorale]
MDPDIIGLLDKFEKSDPLEVVESEDVPRFVKEGCRQAAHCMIHAKWNQLFFDVHPNRCAVMMHLRFDGSLGFPGGLVESGEDALVGLRRELDEEIGSNSEFCDRLGESNRLISHLDPLRRIIYHFYSLEVDYETFVRIERAAIEAHHFGTEVLGNVRPPFYSMGGNKGFATFLSNQFVSNSRDQLVYGLLNNRTFDRQEIKLILQKSLSILNIKY